MVIDDNNLLEIPRFRLTYVRTLEQITVTTAMDIVCNTIIESDHL